MAGEGPRFEATLFLLASGDSCREFIIRLSDALSDAAADSAASGVDLGESEGLWLETVTMGVVELLRGERFGCGERGRRGEGRNIGDVWLKREGLMPAEWEEWTEVRRISAGEAEERRDCRVNWEGSQDERVAVVGTIGGEGRL